MGGRQKVDVALRDGQLHIEGYKGKGDVTKVAGWGGGWIRIGREVETLVVKVNGEENSESACSPPERGGGGCGGHGCGPWYYTTQSVMRYLLNVVERR